jgi:hypothetical protein
MDFVTGATYETNPEKLNDANAWFRIDRFLDASAAVLQRHTGPNGISVFSARRQSGGTESVYKNPRDGGWFRFTSQRQDEPLYRLDLTAISIGRLPHDAMLVFPELQRLAKDIPIADLEEHLLPVFVSMLRDGRAWMAKIVLATWPEMNDFADKVMPNTEWDELRRRDATFGAQYRNALASEGVRFSWSDPRKLPQ